jgi:hypothetical protein
VSLLAVLALDLAALAPRDGLAHLAQRYRLAMLAG